MHAYFNTEHELLGPKVVLSEHKFPSITAIQCCRGVLHPKTVTRVTT